MDQILKPSQSCASSSPTWDRRILSGKKRSNRQGVINHHQHQRFPALPNLISFPRGWDAKLQGLKLEKLCLGPKDRMMAPFVRVHSILLFGSFRVHSVNLFGSIGSVCSGPFGPFVWFFSGPFGPFVWFFSGPFGPFIRVHSVLLFGSFRVHSVPLFGSIRSAWRSTSNQVANVRQLWASPEVEMQNGETMLGPKGRNDGSKWHKYTEKNVKMTRNVKKVSYRANIPRLVIDTD